MADAKVYGINSLLDSLSISTTLTVGTGITLTSGQLLFGSDVILTRDSTDTLGLGTTSAGDNFVIHATPGTTILTWNEANWNEDDVTWTMTGTGALVHVTGNTTAVTSTLTEAVEVGKTYLITITGTGGGATATYTFGGVTGTTIPASGAIAITDYITASTTGVLIITPANLCTVSITLITIKKAADATGDLTVDGNLTVRSPSYFKAPLLATKGANADAAYSFLDWPNSGLDTYSYGSLVLRTTGSNHHVFESSNYFNYSNTATIYMGAGSDIVLTRIAADNLALRRTTNPQTFSFYETYTDASNYESYSLDAGVTTADTFTIKANTAGTGSDNLSIALTPAGTGKVLANSTLIIDGDQGGLANTAGITDVTDTTTTNAYVVGGGQVATTKNTGWLKVYVGTTASWIPYWSNATP